MGCCFSKKDESDRNPPSSSPPPVPDSDISRFKPSYRGGPYSTQLEEETVKEVLSETPTIKPPSFDSYPKIGVEKKTNQNQPILPSFSKIQKVEAKPEPVKEKVEENEEENEEEEKKMKKEAPLSNITVTQEVSEVSEICSLSESYSTTTLTEKKDDEEEGEVRQRINRSPAKNPRRRSNPTDFGYRTPDRGRKSPAKRSEQPSPNRRNDNAGKLMSKSNTDVGQIGRRRMMPENTRTWRRDSGDLGESSRRRSRSPSTRIETGQNKSGLGRNPSTRKTGRKSPAGIPPPVVAPESSSKSEEINEEENGSTNESLENPHVSLECFIFL